MENERVAEPVTRKKRILIFIVAYNAEKTIQEVLRRIPASLQQYDTEVLIIDDASRDRTFERGEEARRKGELPFKLTVLFNPVNQGYGGNQKIGFHYAIQQGFDAVALVHGDGQYAPECLPELLQPLLNGEADAVFGSRMLTPGGARHGGMPLYKFVGNKILTTYQNFMLRAQLSEFHSGYRLYSVPALAKLPFHLNSNVFHFDTEIIIQFLFAGLRIKELPIPTYYGDEICHVDGMKYAWDVAKATFVARAQSWGIFYDRKYDVRGEHGHRLSDAAKLGFDSAPARVLKSIASGAKVLDMSPPPHYLGQALHQAGALVDSLGPASPADRRHLNRHITAAIFGDDELPPLDGYDTVAMLDVIGLHPHPETLVDRLRHAARRGINTRFIVNAGNVGFVVLRLAHLFGQFNYGKRGILDYRVGRLFTYRSLRRLFEQAGFEVLEEAGVPAPFPLAFGDNAGSRALLALNRLLIRLWRGAFSYQIYMVVKPLPSLHYLLAEAASQSEQRAEAGAKKSA
jgi:glycosyltransferase involved in cell wall biosynthesis